jgi:hypothetical protein
MRRSKRLSAISRKRSRLAFQKMRKECCGTKEGFVCPTSRNWRIKYFMKRMSLLIPFIQEGTRCTMILRPLIGGMEWREMLPSMLLFVTLVSELRLNINDLLDCCRRCKCLSGSGKKLHGFYHGIAENSVRIWIYLGNCGSNDQGGSLYTCQDHLLWTTTSRVVYVKDSLSTWTAKEDCVLQRVTVYFDVLGEVAWNLGYPIALQFSLSSSHRWSDQKNELDSGGHAKSLCSAIWKNLG